MFDNTVNIFVLNEPFFCYSRVWLCIVLLHCFVYFFFQVKYLQSCISVCVDFVSPENLSHSCHLVRQFRFLSETQQPAPEDRFQVKNLVFHSVKKALSVREKNKNKRNGKIKAEEKWICYSHTIQKTSQSKSPSFSLSLSSLFFVICESIGKLNLKKKRAKSK